MLPNIPEVVPYWIDRETRLAQQGKSFLKHSTAMGRSLYAVSRSGTGYVTRSDTVAPLCAQADLAKKFWVKLGESLHAITAEQRTRREEVTGVIAMAAGKSFKDALEETEAVHRGRSLCSRRAGATDSRGTASLHLNRLPRIQCSGIRDIPEWCRILEILRVHGVDAESLTSAIFTHIRGE